MNTNGKLFSRIVTAITMVLTILVAAMPMNASVLAAAAFVPDDFNRCGLNTGVWQFQNPANLPATKVTGQFTGDSFLEITVPEGAVATFSNTNKNAPRIMQSATDTDFEIEVKFNSGLGQMEGDNWNIQGILVRDATANKWLRFDLNTNNTSINYYVGYIDENGTLHDLRGPAVISRTYVNDPGPLYLRVKHEKAANRWSVAYQISNKLNPGYRTPIVETDPAEGLPSGFTFNVTHVGVFAGASGSSTPGFVSKVDYFRSVPDAFSDDAHTIKVTKVGNGNVNWPMTNPSQQCSGSQVTLTATPSSGASFTGWTGSLVSANPTIQLTMNQSYDLTATFGTGGGPGPIDLPFKQYAPVIQN